MPITDEVRKYRETVLEQGKVALEEVRKPWYAAVGASDFAYERLQTQLNQLPAEVQARVRKLQTGGRQFDAAAVRSAVENAAEHAADAYGTYAAHARDTYETLAHRGELVVRRLRRSDEVKQTFEKAGDAVADAGKAVSKAEDAVTRPGRPATARKPAAKTSPARKAPAKRAPKA